MAPFHDLHDATMDEIGRGQGLDPLALELDRALGHFAALAVQQVAYCPQGRRLAGTVSAEQGDDAAVRYGE